MNTLKTASQRISTQALFLITALAAQARINVDTLPGRDSAQLTIYNSVDLTMVRETRFLTLRKGLNHLEFSWANTLIDPTSIVFKALSHADEVDVQDVSFPPRVTNTLEWRVRSEFSGEVQAEIRYFTSGINWSADYVIEADAAEKTADLAGYVKINNQSGEDYENAQIRLVVGVVRLVEDIANLARAGLSSSKPGSMMLSDREVLAEKLPQIQSSLGSAFAESESKPKEVVKEGLSEYFLYTVEGRDTIPNGWSKRLPSFETKSIPITSYYKYEQEQGGDTVQRFYRFKNDAASKLGREPLPNGQVTAFRKTTADKLRSIAGQTSVKYIPVNEAVEMDLGPDAEVRVSPTLQDWRKDHLRFDKNGNIAGWTTTESWTIETQNSREIPVTLDIRRNFSGDWEVKSAAGFERLDAAKIKFVLELRPRETKKVTYELVQRFGVNASR